MLLAWNIPVIRTFVLAVQLEFVRSVFAHSVVEHVSASPFQGLPMTNVCFGFSVKLCSHGMEILRPQL